MRGVRYPAEGKAEAVRQVIERGHRAVDVAKRLGMSVKTPVVVHYDQASQLGQ